MRRINLESRQAEANKQLQLAQLEQRRRESSTALRQMHQGLGSADGSARAMRQCMVNMQREVVKPGITLAERKAFIDLTKSFTTSLLQHHADQGSALVEAIDNVLNGAGAVTTKRVPTTRKPAQGTDRKNHRR